MKDAIFVTEGKIEKKVSDFENQMKSFVTLSIEENTVKTYAKIHDEIEKEIKKTRREII